MKVAQHRDQLRQASDAELERMLQDERKTLFIARRESAMKQLENPKRISESRKNIARILTIMREKELAAAKGGG
jgi:large subunit ribosomal protein L29